MVGAVRTSSEYSPQPGAPLVALGVDQFPRRFAESTTSSAWESEKLITAGTQRFDCIVYIFSKTVSGGCTAEGGDPNLALDELARSRYETFGLKENLVARDAILKQPIARIVARRAHRS